MKRNSSSCGALIFILHCFYGISVGDLLKQNGELQAVGISYFGHKNAYKLKSGKNVFCITFAPEGGFGQPIQCVVPSLLF
jgi:hypothetical protein